MTHFDRDDRDEAMTETANLVARLTGFTPGPWRADRAFLENLGGFSTNKGVICDFGDSSRSYPTEGVPPSAANAALIAAAPDLHRHVVELLDRQAAAIAREAALREALHYYGDFTDDPHDGPWGVNSDDYGTKARAALEVNHDAL